MTNPKGTGGGTKPTVVPPPVPVKKDMDEKDVEIVPPPVPFRKPQDKGTSIVPPIVPT